MTHFYFHDRDGVCFLRVHTPDRHGDVIKRFTMAEAASTGMTSHGIELGPLGTFTLRVVHPWTIDGQLAGYIELGEEIDHVAPHLKQVLDVELVVTIDKSYVERAAWEAGLAAMGRKAEWDEFDNFLEVGSTMEDVPAGLQKVLQQPQSTIRNYAWRVVNGDKQFHVGVVPLVDKGGRDVGQMSVLVETTGIAHIDRIAFVAVGLTLAVLVTAALAVAYLYLGRVEHALNSATEFICHAKDEAERTAAELRKLTRAVEQSPASVVIASLDGTIEYVNPGFTKTSGYSFDEVVGENPRILQSGLHTHDFYDQMWDVLGSRQVWRGELCNKKKCGELYWEDATISPIFNERGKITNYVAVKIDITVSKQAQERYRVLFESSHDAMTTLEPASWKFTSGNQAAITLFGMRDETEFTSFGPLDLSPETQPDGRPSAEKAKEMVETAMSKGSHFFEWTHSRLSGEAFPSTVLLTRMEIGGQTLIQATIRDITAQKQAEEDRERSKKTLEKILESMPVGVVIIGKDRTVRQVNSAAIAMTGHDDYEQILGCTCHQVLCPAEKCNCPVLDLGQRIDNAERVLITKDKKEVPVLNTVVPITLDGEDVLLETFVDISERKAAEKELKKLSSAIEQSPASVMITDPSGNITYTNPAFSSLTGYSSEEVKGKNPRILTSGENAPEVYEAMWKTLHERESWRGELCNRKKNGELYWQDTTISPVVDRRGELVSYVSVKIDVTDKKRAATELNSFKVTLDQIHDAVFIFDPVSLKFNYCNREAVQQVGYSSDELMQMTPLDIEPQLDLEHLRSFIAPLTSGNEPALTFETIHGHKDGHEVPVETTLQFIESEEGNSRFVAISRDITERKATEARLASQNRLALLSARVGTALAKAASLQDGLQECCEAVVEQLDAALVRVWTMDSTGTTLELQASAGMCIHLNGRHSRVLVGEGKIGLVALHGTERLTNDVINDPEISDRDWAEREGIVSYASYPLTTGDRVTGVAALFARQPLTDETLNGLDAISDTVALFVERLKAQAALQMAKEAAEEASRAKSQFLASMSHELRTPLNGVIGMTELLKNTTLDSRQQQFVEACHSSGRSLMGLINDILDFSKIEAGKLDLDEHEFDLVKLVEETATTMAFSARKKGIDLFSRTSFVGSRMVKGDSARLRQVLVNLSGNAIKFTEGGEVIVRVKTVDRNREHEIIRFEVSDTGIGIAPDAVGKLFQSFSQADTSTTRKYGGTGLGLAICKSLVELMGGQIGVESEVGRGSTFWFEVPLGLCETSGISLRFPPLLRGRRVLLLAGNAAIETHLVETLTSWQVETESANTVEAALSMPAAVDGTQPPFDLLIIDEAAVPGASLSGFVQRLRSRAQFRDLKMLYITETADVPAPLQQRILGINSCLSVPVCQSMLLNAMNDCFDKSTGRPPVDLIEEDAPSLPSDLTGKRVLLAEDNTTNQLFAREVLKHGGMHCDCVMNGEESLDAVRSQAYDIILMDCQMPEMDGFEATRIIRQMERDGELAGHVPIIALTANAIKGDRERCLEAGMDDYISKPFEPQLLLQLIASLMCNSPNTSVPVEADQPQTVEQAPSAVAAPIDHETLLGRCMGEVDFAEELLTDFKVNLPSRIDEIARFIAEEDAAGVGEAAHSLKGAAGIVAAESVRSLAAAMEQRGKTDDLSGIAALLDELNEEVQRCIAYLDEPERVHETTNTVKSD